MILANQAELEKYKLIQEKLNDKRKKLLDAEQIIPVVNECVKKSQSESCDPMILSLIESGKERLLKKHSVDDIYELETFIVEERKKVKQLTEDVAFIDKYFSFPDHKEEKKFIGVRMRDNKWISEIGLNGTRYFGGFDTQKEAAFNNDQDRIHLFGPLYPREMLNFPENWEKYLGEKNKSVRVEELLEKNKGKFYPDPVMRKKET